MSKTDNRVRNWSQYNKSLINRGSITFWLDETSLQSWYETEQTSGKGRPKKYSAVAIKTLLVLKQIYRLSLRACMGFAVSLFKLMKLDLQVTSYTQLSRRQSGLDLPQLPTVAGSIHLVIDATGLKIFGQGEWMVRQHGWTKRRIWRKLHIGVDEKSQLIVSAALTEKTCTDAKALPILLNQYKGECHQISGDGAYDSHQCIDGIVKRGAKAVIPSQSHPRHNPKQKDHLKNARDEIAWDIQQHGKKEWKERNNYHRRSLAETAFYRYKQLLGDKLSSRKLKSQQVEALLRCHMLNYITLSGIPSSIAI